MFVFVVFFNKNISDLNLVFATAVYVTFTCKVLCYVLADTLSVRHVIKCYFGINHLRGTNNDGSACHKIVYLVWNCKSSLLCSQKLTKINPIHRYIETTFLIAMALKSF